MVFSVSSKDISISLKGDLTYLFATCKTKSGEWNDKNPPINLDWYIGLNDSGFYMTLANDDKNFDRVANPFAKHMKPGNVKLKYGSVLSGTLKDEYGGKEVSLCLDLCFAIDDDGHLAYLPLYAPLFPAKNLIFSQADDGRLNNCRHSEGPTSRAE